MDQERAMASASTLRCTGESEEAEIFVTKPSRSDNKPSRSDNNSTGGDSTPGAAKTKQQQQSVKNTEITIPHDNPHQEKQQQQQETGETTPKSNQERTKPRRIPIPTKTTTKKIWRNIPPARSLLTSYLATLIFTLLYCLFIHHVLINKKPQVGAVLFDATTSNLLISIFSQLFVLLSDATVCGLLDTMRTALASRSGGTSASAFFGISAATGWLSAFRLASVNGFSDVWCDFRLILPVLGLLFGSVLKCQFWFPSVFFFSPFSLLSSQSRA